MQRRLNYEVWKIAGRWQHAKNASMVEMITIKNSLGLVTSIKGIRLGKMVKMIKFLFFAQKVSSGMGALRPKFLGG